jgi:hypothetical protein
MSSYSPLYTSEIERAVLSDPVHRKQKHFLGVFASNQLPHTIRSFPASLVVNTDPAHKPGTHWIAYHFDDQRRLDYFDSEGLPPLPRDGSLAQFANRNASTIAYCNRPLQGIHSAACGYYCIAFLVLRAQNYSLADIVAFYWGGRPGVYDDAVSEAVHRLFGVGTDTSVNQAAGSRSYRPNEQCSCSIAQWCCDVEKGR